MVLQMIVFMIMLFCSYFILLYRNSVNIYSGEVLPLY